METIVGVRFRNARKIYYFDPSTTLTDKGDWVVVETARGQEMGEVVIGNKQIPKKDLKDELKPVLRVATSEDMMQQSNNERIETHAFEICQAKILEHKLDMKLVRVECAFDNSKLLFYFTANGRVDFRNLVKELAYIFKMRIELRQIGVRDEAKMIGGLGSCGRSICCDSFLPGFQPVSIKMAKEQNLSLNPVKISGVCGRLMCCLQYEQEGYEEARKKMPKIGKEVLVPEGKGVVWEVNVLKETIKVKIETKDGVEIREYQINDLRKTEGDRYEASPASQEGPSLEEEFVFLDPVNLTTKVGYVPCEEVCIQVCETRQAAQQKEKTSSDTSPLNEPRDKPQKDVRKRQTGRGRPDRRTAAGRRGKGPRKAATTSSKEGKDAPKPEKRPRKKRETSSKQGKLSPWQKAVKEAIVDAEKQ